MQEHLFKPILEIVIETMPRDNLLNSACLEFFEYIKRENIKVLIIHIVENYREELQQIDYVDTFKELVLKYEQNQNPAPSFATQSTMTPAPEELSARRTQWQGNARDLDAAEEEYFNTSDNEDEDEAIASKAGANVNGSSPATKPLVDYNSDEDTDLLATDLSAGIETQKDADNEQTLSTPADDSTSASTNPKPVTPSRPPPERLSEKRRREEDEEDELGKLSQSKRRSSMSSNGSTSSNGGSVGMLRRKRNFNPSKDNANGGDNTKGAAASGSTSGPKKIAISIMPTTITSSGEGSDKNGV